MPPSRGRDALGVLAASATPAAAHSSLSTSSRKIFVSAATARGRSANAAARRESLPMTDVRDTLLDLVARG